MIYAVLFCTLCLSFLYAAIPTKNQEEPQNETTENSSRLYFDPQQVAKEETAAWKDYYNNDVTGLVEHLAHLVILEFRINQLMAWKTVIPELVTAAAVFKSLPDSAPQEIYTSKVLPHLVTAYEGIREGLHGSWDAHQAAEDELAWWMYRRNQKKANPEIVAKKIADLYRLIYGNHDQNYFDRAAYLRAVAARYRDLSQLEWSPIDEEDWLIIEHILQESYKELLLGIEANLRL